jgi:hypothetical protein
MNDHPYHPQIANPANPFWAPRELQGIEVLECDH